MLSCSTSSLWVVHWLRDAASSALRFMFLEGLSCGFGWVSPNRARLCESFCSFCGETSVGVMVFVFEKGLSWCLVASWLNATVLVLGLG